MKAGMLNVQLNIISAFTLKSCKFSVLLILEQNACILSPCVVNAATLLSYFISSY